MNKLRPSLLTLFLCAFLILFSRPVLGQTDSTILKISGVADREVRLSNKLNGVQMLTLECPDTSMLGKQFRLFVDEYDKGVLVESDSFGISCEDKKYPIVIGEDTAYYYFNMCSRISYTENCTNDGFYIMFGGKLEGDTFRMKIKYPGIELDKVLVGSNDYILKTIDCRLDEDFWFNLESRTAILAYSPPFKIGNGLSSYCLLNARHPSEWYETYGVEHFYIFALKIM